jgi:hypothetical protein
MIIKILDVSSSGSFSLPAASFIQSVVVRNKTVHKLKGGLKFGHNEDKNNIIGSLSVSPLEIVNVTVNSNVVDFENPTEIHFDANVDWNSSLLDIFVTCVNLET